MTILLDKKYSFITYNIIDSSNKEAKRLSRNIIPQNVIVWAKEQTEPYGRINRRWNLGKGNLGFSAMILHQYHIDFLARFVFITSLSIYHVINSLFHKYNIKEEITLKWPNDVLINGKKISGILIENIELSEQVKYMIIGIGMNIASKPSDPTINASCLLDFINAKLDSSKILIDIVNTIESYRIKAENEGFSTIKEEWLSHAYNFNKNIKIFTGIEYIEGKFIGIEDNAHIKIKLQSGFTTFINTGEIVC